MCESNILTRKMKLKIIKLDENSEKLMFGFSKKVNFTIVFIIKVIFIKTLSFSSLFT